MLILTRRAGESILIGPDVALTLLGSHGNQVRLGITAPRTVTIFRQEVYERIRRDPRENLPRVPVYELLMGTDPGLHRRDQIQWTAPA